MSIAIKSLPKNKAKKLGLFCSAVDRCKVYKEHPEKFLGLFQVLGNIFLLIASGSAGYDKTFSAISSLLAGAIIERCAGDRHEKFQNSLSGLLNKIENGESVDLSKTNSNKLTSKMRGWIAENPIAFFSLVCIVKHSLVAISGNEGLSDKLEKWAGVGAVGCGISVWGELSKKDPSERNFLQKNSRAISSLSTVPICSVFLYNAVSQGNFFLAAAATCFLGGVGGMLFAKPKEPPKKAEAICDMVEKALTEKGMLGDEKAIKASISLASYCYALPKEGLQKILNCNKDTCKETQRV